MATDEQVVALADRSPLLHYAWPDRGLAPSAYIRGMAVAFAHLFRVLKAAERGDVVKQAVDRATAKDIGAPSSDILAWYSAELNTAGAKTATADDKLVALFAVMVGLGMRESSGQYCAGADTPGDRGEPTTEANAEAGLFQVSFDSINGDPLRQNLFDTYKDRADLLDVFKAGVSCSASDSKNFGSGSGAKFQQAMKHCPLFAVLYTSLYLRSHRKHWGPINKRKAEVRSAAVDLFFNIILLFR